MSGSFVELLNLPPQQKKPHSWEQGLILGGILYSSVVRFDDIEFAMLNRMTPPKKAPKARYINNIFHDFLWMKQMQWVHGRIEIL